MTEVANLLPPILPQVEQDWRKLLPLFVDDNQVSYHDRLTPTQIQIIDIIASRKYPRTQLILPTQYGKSLSVALGVLLRVITHKERWAIIAPTEDKARIIMDYIIDHIFDDPLFTEQLEYYNNKEQLKRERSKTRITFREGGEVRVYSGNASNSKETKRALMGFGAANIILDESALINDELYSTVLRMLGGSKDNFLLEIGNPFFRNHFHKSWFGQRFKKIYVDVYKALAEGRYTQEYIDEMSEQAFFDVLYECKFPDANEVLPNGYRRLLTDAIVDGAYIDSPLEIVEDDKPILGIDVASGGKNETKLIIRFPKSGFAFVAKTLNIPQVSDEDLGEVADAAEDLIKTWGIGDYRTVYDAGGIGYGLGAIMRERGILVKAVLFGEKAPEATFLNMRAYMYWQARKWLRAEGGKLVRDIGFEEMKLIYYKRNSQYKTQMEPKDEMIKRKTADGEKVESPDTADAFILTFVDTSTIVEDDDIVVD